MLAGARAGGDALSPCRRRGRLFRMRRSGGARASYSVWRAEAGARLGRRGDAASLATAAALCFVAARPRRHTDPAARESALALAARASELDPTERRIGWLRLQLCAQLPPAATSARQRPRCAGWMRTTAPHGCPRSPPRKRIRDPVEIDRVLADMAQGSRFDSYWNPTVVLMFDALRRARAALPPQLPSFGSREAERGAGRSPAAEIVPPFIPCSRPAANRRRGAPRETCLEALQGHAARRHRHRADGGASHRERLMSPPTARSRAPSPSAAACWSGAFPPRAGSRWPCCPGRRMRCARARIDEMRAEAARGGCRHRNSSKAQTAARAAARGGTMIDLYYWPTPNGHKITLFLEETGLPYRLVPVNIGTGEQFKPRFLAISPNNRMPAIVDHDAAWRGRADLGVRVGRDPAVPRREDRAVHPRGHRAAASRCSVAVLAGRRPRADGGARIIISPATRRRRFPTPSSATSRRRTACTACSTGASPIASTLRAPTPSRTWRLPLDRAARAAGTESRRLSQREALVRRNSGRGRPRFAPMRWRRISKRPAPNPSPAILARPLRARVMGGKPCEHIGHFRDQQARAARDVVRGVRHPHERGVDA